MIIYWLMTFYRWLWGLPSVTETASDFQVRMYICVGAFFDMFVLILLVMGIVSWIQSRKSIRE